MRRDLANPASDCYIYNNEIEMPPRRAAIMETEVCDMAGTDRLLEAIDKMTLALQELREAVLELTAD